MCRGPDTGNGRKVKEEVWYCLNPAFLLQTANHPPPSRSTDDAGG
ncbi:hypothetical protein HMPREF3038_00356 [Akkermansia sp. KLE1797]|nr:hypothetical protein HMPREF3038_00356 [Akkermansia sp. KLE1797]KXU55050.1 hypothetical protein HMPREF3039_00775 [Akkermansia sp. KLE1798]KZA04318.1 hypothetical protein HMPREF1326_01986 [Akkermansia sp. KLE1605]